MTGRDIVIRCRRQDRVGLRPISRRRAPDAREIEPVAVRQREAVVLAPAAMAKFRGGDEAAMSREATPFSAENGERPAAGLAWLKSTRQRPQPPPLSVTPSDHQLFGAVSFGLA